MNNFKEHVFPKTTLALSITASIINSPRTFPIHSLNRTKEVNFISIIKLRFDVPHQEFAGRQYQIDPPISLLKCLLHCGCFTPLYDPKFHFVKVVRQANVEYCNFCLKSKIFADFSSLHTCYLKPLFDNKHFGLKYIFRIKG